MRSWSISVGRLFGVDVRLHLTFLILPVFIYWTDYATRQQNANGARDLALVGIILACVAAHEFGHMLAARRFGLVPKAVILLPLTLIARIFGMNVKVPGQGSISGFWIVCVAMVVVLGAMIAVFRRRGLL